MSVATGQIVSLGVRNRCIARAGLFLRRHQGAILAVQWAIVLVYLVLVLVPVFLPLPAQDAVILGSFTRISELVFWGLWWPFVVISIMVFGRAWCGLLCPEGTLTEWVSQYGLGLKVPRWIKWCGWPFVAFMTVALYGQLMSLHEFPQPTLLILGGSTVVAMVIGLLYGRGKRVWCRYLCPVCGVFEIMARVAPVHFQVDREAWDAAPHGSRTSLQHRVNCAPLIDIRRMKSASDCQMCGRCAGERGAVQLALRPPGAEILDRSRRREPDMSDRWLARLLVCGMIGAALGAFQWNVSPWFEAAKLAAAAWLRTHGLFWPLGSPGHWWIMTYYPAADDMFSWLDGAMVVAYISAEALVIGGWVAVWMRIAGSLAGLPWQRMAEVLIPFAGINLFIGSSLLAVSQNAGTDVLPSWTAAACMVLLGLATLWGASVAVRLTRRRVAALAVVAAAALPLAAWSVEFFVWHAL